MTMNNIDQNRVYVNMKCKGEFYSVLHVQPRPLMAEFTIEPQLIE